VHLDARWLVSFPCATGDEVLRSPCPRLSQLNVAKCTGVTAAGVEALLRGGR